MSVRTAYISSFALGLLSWGALVALVIYTKPDGIPQLGAALLLFVLAISATSMPFWGRIHQKLTARPSEPIIRIAVRQGLWAGLFVAILLAFHFTGLLDWILILVTLILFVLLEAFLQQRSRWHNGGKKKRPPSVATTQPARSTGTSSGQAAVSMARTKRGRKRNQAKVRKSRKKAQ